MADPKDYEDGIVYPYQWMEELIPPVTKLNKKIEEKLEEIVKEEEKERKNPLDDWI